MTRAALKQPVASPVWRGRSQPIVLATVRTTEMSPHEILAAFHHAANIARGIYRPLPGAIARRHPPAQLTILPIPQPGRPDAFGANAAVHCQLRSGVRLHLQLQAQRLTEGLSATLSTPQRRRPGQLTQLEAIHAAFAGACVDLDPHAVVWR